MENNPKNSLRFLMTALVDTKKHMQELPKLRFSFANKTNDIEQLAYAKKTLTMTNVDQRAWNIYCTSCLSN
jgi:hypothetical protein